MAKHTLKILRCEHRSWSFYIVHERAMNDNVCYFKIGWLLFLKLLIIKALTDAQNLQFSATTYYHEIYLCKA